MAICSYISHEIRNPLQAILFKAEVLKNSHLSLEQLEELNSIILHSKHIEKVADGILKLHKIEAARERKLAADPFKLSQLANTVIEPLKILAKSKKIKQLPKNYLKWVCENYTEKKKKKCVNTLC